jgi:hypothetical protein
MCIDELKKMQKINLVATSILVSYIYEFQEVFCLFVFKWCLGSAAQASLELAVFLSQPP